METNHSLDILCLKKNKRQKIKMNPTEKPFILDSSEINKNPLFIDKTMFIKEFMEDGSDVTCILRPRRFGKSTNLSMLQSFLSIGSQAASFRRYSIGKQTAFVKQHCGKYPVVYLNLKDCTQGETWDQMYQEVWLCIRKMVKKHEKDLDHINLSLFQLNETETVAPINSASVSSSLKWLIKSLY